MTIATSHAADVMQVCRNGHVITDRLLADPRSGRNHCDRCGAATLNRCVTCGHELLGAVVVPGLIPIGNWPAPKSCRTCGASFPWARRPRSSPSPLPLIDSLLRRLPRAIRQMRWRQGDRPPVRVEDERDLEDLLRAMLPLHFDDVRLECRTPRYAPTTRTDLILAPERIALTVKIARPNLREPQLAEQWQQDIAYYQQKFDCRTLVGYIHDPEGLLRDTPTLESVWSGLGDDLELRCIIDATGDTA